MDMEQPQPPNGEQDKQNVTTATATSDSAAKSATESQTDSAGASQTCQQDSSPIPIITGDAPTIDCQVKDTIRKLHKQHQQKDFKTTSDMDAGSCSTKGALSDRLVSPSLSAATTIELESPASPASGRESDATRAQSKAVGLCGCCGVATTRSGSSCADDDDERELDRKSNDNQMALCIINKPLIPLKIILFCWYAAGSCLLPYMTLHMKQLGLTIAETTAVYALLPIIQLFGTPIAGFIADKTGNYKSVLLFALYLCIMTTFMLQFVVPGRKVRDPTLPPLGAEEAADEAEATRILSKITFWLYLVIRIFHQVTVALIYTLLDTTTLILSKEHNSHYGRNRFWAILATGIFSPICGYIMDQISTTKDSFGTKIMNFDPAFYFFEIFTALTLFLVANIKMPIEVPTTDLRRKLVPLLRTPGIWMFLFSVFIMGSCWGFLESFLFIHLQKLNAPNYLMGLTVTVGAFVGLPFLYNSDWFIKKFNLVRLLIIALLVYFIRLIGYSLIDNPWFCIPYELMEAFSFHLMWVSCVQLAHDIAPEGLLATLQAVVGGLNFGVGRGFGSLVGGAAIVMFDMRTAFRVIGSIALATGILYTLLEYFKPTTFQSNRPDHNANKVEASDIKKARPIRDSRRRRQNAKDIEANCQETRPAQAS